MFNLCQNSPWFNSFYQSLHFLSYRNTNHHIRICMSQRVDEQKPKVQEEESVQLCGRI